MTVDSNLPGSKAIGWKIYNNTINGKGRTDFDGIRLSVGVGGDISNIEVVNNIVFGAGSYGGRTHLEPDAIYSSARIANNLFYDSGHNSWLGDSSVTGTIVGDPRFVGGTGPEAYKLQSDSPAIRAGASVPLAYDFGGNKSESVPNIGAWWGNESVLRPPTNVQVNES